jgi:hypothetical protein
MSKPQWVKDIATLGDANVQTLTTLPRQEFPGYLHVRLDCVYRIHWNLRKFRSDRELRDVSNVRHYRGVAVP